MQVRIKPLVAALFSLSCGACAAADATAATATATATATAAAGATMQRWQHEVRTAECGFATSMARRDLAAFERHLSAQALFFGSSSVLSGRAAVVAAWRGFYEGPTAPFSWEPDQVVAIEDGSLAYSTGLVRNPKGELSGRFASVWRQEAPGQWRVVIDRGVELSAADRAAPQPMGQGCQGLARP